MDKLRTDPLLDRRTVLKGLGLLGISAAAAACGGGTSTVLPSSSTSGGASTNAPAGSRPAASASKPQPSFGGTLNYIGFEGEDDKTAAASFLSKYNVTLQSTYINDNPEILTKYRAGGPGKYDVGAQYDRYIPLMIEEGMVQPIDLDLVPNFQSLYPAMQNAPWVHKDGKVWAIPAYFGFLSAFNYRADKIDPPPSSYPIPYEVLIDPKYQGKVGVRSDATDNLLLIGSLVYGFGVDGTKYTKDQLNRCLEWAKKLRANAKTQLGGYGELADAFIRGDIWLGTVGWEYISLQGQQAGVNVTHNKQLSGPAPAWSDSYMIFTGSQNVETAHGWINEMLSPEAMTKTTQSLGSFVTNSLVPPKLPPDFASAMGYDAVKDQLERAQFGVLPAAQQSDPNLATLDDFNSGWEAIWA